MDKVLRTGGDPITTEAGGSTRRIAGGLSVSGRTFDETNTNQVMPKDGNTSGLYFLQVSQFRRQRIYPLRRLSRVATAGCFTFLRLFEPVLPCGRSSHRTDAEPLIFVRGWNGHSTQMAQRNEFEVRGSLTCLRSHLLNERWDMLKDSRMAFQWPTQDGLEHRDLIFASGVQITFERKVPVTFLPVSDQVIGDAPLRARGGLAYV